MLLVCGDAYMRKGEEKCCASVGCFISTQIDKVYAERVYPNQEAP